MKKWTGAYVAHYCKKCDNIFIAEDYTNAKINPPKWRYCREYCEKLGIDYDKQTPKTNRTPEQQKKINEQIERLKKYRFGNN